MLTYLSGPWPGIYHFSDGRLKEIDRAPEPPAPAKPPPKKKATKKKPANAKTSQGYERYRAVTARLYAVSSAALAASHSSSALAKRGDDLGAGLGELGGARRVARKQFAVGQGWRRAS